MERRYRWLPDWLYYFGTLPALACLPRRLSFKLACRHARNLRVSRRANFEQIVRMLAAAPSLGGLPIETRDRIAGLVFEKMVCEDLDAYYFPFWNARNIGSYFAFTGLERLERALGRGRGVLLYTAHYGSVCAPVVALALKGYNLHQLSRDSRTDSSLPRAFRSYARFKTGWMAKRMGRGLVFIDSTEGAYSAESAVSTSLQAASVLDRNGIVSLAVDVPPYLVRADVIVEFLGRRCRFPSGLVALAAQSGATVLPYFAIRDNSNPSLTRLEVAEEVSMTGKPNVDMQAVVERVSAMIASHPEQWFAWDSFSRFWE